MLNLSWYVNDGQFVFLYFGGPFSGRMFLSTWTRNLLQCFGCFLGLGSLDCPQVSLRTIKFCYPFYLFIYLLSWVINFIFTELILHLTTYLGSWALVAPIFIARFLSNNCPFLLEVISVKSFGLFPFQAQPS
jgi:hypothetical protein